MALNFFIVCLASVYDSMPLLQQKKTLQKCMERGQISNDIIENVAKQSVN